MSEEKDEIPRRADVSRNTEAERAIRRATVEVECLGADERLTRAVVLLEEARNAVADWVDANGIEVGPTGGGA